MVTVGNGIFSAKFLDKKCYTVMTLSSMMFYVETVALLLAKTENWMMVVDFLIIEEHFL